MMAFAVSLWDIEILLAGLSCTMLITSELLSPYYGNVSAFIDRKNLRLVGLGFFIIFILIGIARVVYTLLI
jgi:hypothetical protein